MVDNINNSSQSAGQHNLKFDGNNIKQGVYFIKLSAISSNNSYSKTNVIVINR